MSVAKIPAIFLIVWGVHITTSPPTPAIPQQERKTKDGPLDVHAAGRIFKVSLVVVTEESRLVKPV